MSSVAAQRVFLHGPVPRCCFPRLLHIVLYDVCCGSSSNYHVYCCVLDPLAICLHVIMYSLVSGFCFCFWLYRRWARSTFHYYCACFTPGVYCRWSIASFFLRRNCFLWSSLLSSCFLALCFPFCRCELQAAAAAAASSSSSSSFGFLFCFIAFVLEQVLELLFGASARK